jgi:hypothetical protein
MVEALSNYLGDDLTELKERLREKASDTHEPHWE